MPRYSRASSCARAVASGSVTSVPLTHRAAPGPTVPTPTRTRDRPRTTAAGSPLGSRPVCSTTPSVPTAEYLPSTRGTSSTRGLSSPVADTWAASIAARASGPDMSSGTTMVGSTTESSSGSTGRERVSLTRVHFPGRITCLHLSSKRCPGLFPAAVRGQHKSDTGLYSQFRWAVLAERLRRLGIVGDGDLQAVEAAQIQPGPPGVADQAEHHLGANRAARHHPGRAGEDPGLRNRPAVLAVRALPEGRGDVHPEDLAQVARQRVAVEPGLRHGLPPGLPNRSVLIRCGS